MKENGDRMGGDDAARAKGAQRNLTYRLLDSLGRAIVVGDLDSRPFPTEAGLAKQYSVSRSVTREAVKMLGAKGLLTARPRRGTTIQPADRWNLFDPDVLRWMLERRFSVQLLRQFNELRLAIEPAAADLAARAGTPSDVASVRLGYQRMVAAEAGKDDPLDADIAFHLAVLRASGNPFFLQFQDLVTTALRTSIHFTNRFVGRTASLPQHYAVLEAIESGAPAVAAAAMRELIDDVLKLISAANDES